MLGKTPKCFQTSTILEALPSSGFQSTGVKDGASGDPFRFGKSPRSAPFPRIPPFVDFLRAQGRSQKSATLSIVKTLREAKHAAPRHA